jgi:hypothetical protein
MKSIRDALIVFVIIIELSGCLSMTIGSFGYKLGEAIYPPIEAKIKIEIHLDDFIKNNLIPKTQQEIREGIKKDIVADIFPLLEDKTPELYVDVYVRLLKGVIERWGFFWLPLACAGVPFHRGLGDAEILLSISNSGGEEISKYLSTKRVKIWGNSLYYANNPISYVLREAMDDIKSQIVRDRNKIIEAI